MNLSNIWALYEEAWSTRDPRVDGWLFMSSVKPTVFFVSLAICVVVYGPRYMKTRAPLNIGPIMVTYNLLIVIVNIYIAYQLMLGTYIKQYDLVCEPNHPNDTDDVEMELVNGLHLYYMCKLLELFESFFVIARKRPTDQNAVLLIHHIGMALFSWNVTRFCPTASVLLLTSMNSGFHAVMYLYLVLSYLQPTLVKTPKIKMAFAYFVLVQSVVQLGYILLVIWTGCPWTLKRAYYLGSLLIFMMVFQNIPRHSNTTGKGSNHCS